jgi:hypothetical protein
MKKYKIGILALAALGLGSTGASAATINLYGYAFNVDGTVYDVLYADPINVPGGTITGTLPGGINQDGLNKTNGIGTISFTTSGAGAHSFLAFFDHEMVEEQNTYFNEYGAVNGTQGAVQSWEIDEPGWDMTNPGDIYSNFKNSNNISGSQLDNSNTVPSGSENDVSMAMGWDFNLDTGETAFITLTLSETAPTSGFYLAQFDNDTGAGLYFSGNLNITGGGNPVPEPATMLLMATGLTGLLGARARRKMKK